MKEAIKIIVIIEQTEPDDSDEAELELIVDGGEDIFSLLLDGKEVCCGDWVGNLKPFFKRALELWE